MKAALVYSGATDDSADNQDTLVQLEEISVILKSLNIETYEVAFNDSVGEVERELFRIKPDFVFNLVETLNATDSLIYLAAALYEMMKIPYTGCSAISLAMLASKIHQKQMLRQAGLPTADFFYDESEADCSGGTLFSGGPWIVKSDSEHASVGMNSDSVVQTVAEAKQKIEQNKITFGGKWFVERFIDGREFNLSLLPSRNGRLRVLPPAEICFVNFPKDKPKIVDYAAKWDADSDVYQATQRSFVFAPDDQNLLLKLEKICHQCWQLFGLNGAARIDFRIDTNGNPWILEINANPCLSSDAGFMVAAEKAKLSVQDVIKSLIPSTILSRVSSNNV
ncbi:MAG: D-alanine--D-alanine ligase [Gammaproteobacteria bacterium]|nr:D-alanine--D-alanine ligase [Gammaproteobacteria bacterium]